MDKTMIMFAGGVLIVAFVFFATANALFFSNAPTTGAVTAPTTAPSGDAQVVYLSAQGLNYVVSQSTVQVNKPVRFVGDPQKLPGCSRSIVIPQLGLRKVFSETDTILEFTPTQKGPLAFSCGMGMYRGSVTVA